MRNADNHLSESVTPYSNLGWRERLRIRWWGVLARLTEAKWLEANGWFQAPSGWLPPEWHPKSPERLQEKSWRRGTYILYDQNHAANSQRKYRDMPQRPSQREGRQRPAYPAYVRYAPYQIVISMLAAMIFIMAATAAVSVYAIALAGALLVCVSFAIARSQERDLRVEYVEDILRRS